MAVKSRVIKGETNVAPPWQPCDTTEHEILAIQALMLGKASEVQQHQFIAWFKRATAFDELEFRPSDERASCFAAGKRFVALQCFSLAKARLPAPR